MALLTPGRLGPYEVLSKLGEGGMGQVFKARDTRLGRDVALKILPEAFAGDVDRITRFEREARALASLNHPNVAHVYDTGRDGAVVFIAMELVDGEDLGAIIARGPIPLSQSIAIARQIASGLEAAHEAGIIHRDLKPANIKVREDGTVKVLDFGLAKALSPDSAISSTDAMMSPTMTSPATRLGVILGTAAYMSPEQARGKAVDRRADVWAFGVVLFEMLTGRTLFARDEVSDSLAAVLTHQPDLESLPPGTPPALHRLLSRCLVKEPRERLDSMRAVRLELEDAARGKTGEGRAPQARSHIVAAVLLLLTGALAGWGLSKLMPASRPDQSAQSTPLYASLVAPEGLHSAFHSGFALSPDGETIAFSVRDRAGARHLWTRPINALDAQSVRGTEGGTYPMWSPDGREIAFFAGGKLKRVPASGGPALAICDAPGLFSTGSWGSGGLILFASYHDRKARLRSVSVSSGSVTELTELGEGMRPIFLPDGKRFLYVGGPEQEWGLRLASIGGGTSKFLRTIGNFRYSYGAGHVFTNQNDVLTAQRFDETGGDLVGPVVTIAGLAGDPNTWFAVSAAADRVVALARSSPEAGSAGDPMARLVWVNREGEELGTLGEAGRYWTMALSPDDRRVAVSQGSDLLVLSSAGGRVRLTHGSESWNPVWNADGTELLLTTSMTGVVRRRLEAGAVGQPLENMRGAPSDWSHDGAFILVGVGSSAADIFVYDVAAKVLKPWLVTNADERSARLSPDDKWVAFMSDEGGQSQVYVRPLAGSFPPTPVSLQGGLHPTWGAGGKELFFLAADGSMMAATFNSRGNNAEIGRPKLLFRIPLNDITSDWFPPYDVSTDGQRFLLNIPDRPEPLFFLQGLNALMTKK
jgi:eukaryotic-like serine/threonine-protein kinase